MSSNRPAGTVSYNNAGRVVIVTGGAGGIGSAICKSFADSGAQVACIDVRPPEVDVPRVDFFQGNVADETNCQETVAEIVKRFERVDVLVNNAAIQNEATYRPVHELDGDVWRRSMDVNVSGYTYMAKYVIQQMLKQQNGVIINIASAQAHRTAREVSAYGPTKAANVLQAKQWAVEYARHGIRAVSISPGAINTPLVQASLERQGGAAELANRHPLGRIGEPFEIANAALWLASDDAGFITATDLEVDGGLGGYGSFADPYPREK